MDAFVALTGLDETNIILSMYAAQGEHCKVIAKVNRPSFADLATANGMLDSVVSTSTVTTEAILQYVRAMQNTLGSNIKALHRIVGGQVEALEFGVRRDAPFAGVAAQGPAPSARRSWSPVSCGPTARPSSPPAATRCSPATMWSL